MDASTIDKVMRRPATEFKRPKRPGFGDNNQLLALHTNEARAGKAIRIC
jgi:hypothetical protein